MSETPDYIRHIMQSDINHNAFCGKNISMEWAFVDVGHAIAERLRNGRLLPCPDCVKKINEILSS